MIQVIGKKSRIVPILLTRDMVSAIDVLMTTRAGAGIPNENQYVFARPGGITSLRFYVCLKEVAKSAGLKRPDLITSTRMRKRLATMVQVRRTCLQMFILI